MLGADFVARQCPPTPGTGSVIDRGVLAVRELTRTGTSATRPTGYGPHEMGRYESISTWQVRPCGTDKPESIQSLEGIAERVAPRPRTRWPLRRSASR